MDIFGFNILELVTNPVGAITSVATGLIFFQGYKFITSVLRPISYVEKLYSIADKIVEQADDRFIDKIRNKQIKKDVQKRLRCILHERKEKINRLIERIKD